MLLAWSEKDGQGPCCVSIYEPCSSAFGVRWAGYTDNAESMIVLSRTACSAGSCYVRELGGSTTDGALTATELGRSSWVAETTPIVWGKREPMPQSARHRCRPARGSITDRATYAHAGRSVRAVERALRKTHRLVASCGVLLGATNPWVRLLLRSHGRVLGIELRLINVRSSPSLIS